MAYPLILLYSRKYTGTCKCLIYTLFNQSIGYIGKFWRLMRRHRYGNMNGRMLSGQLRQAFHKKTIMKSYIGSKQAVWVFLQQ